MEIKDKTICIFIKKWDNMLVKTLPVVFLSFIRIKTILLKYLTHFRVKYKKLNCNSRVNSCTTGWKALAYPNGYLLAFLATQAFALLRIHSLSSQRIVVQVNTFSPSELIIQFLTNTQTCPYFEAFTAVIFFLCKNQILGLIRGFCTVIIHIPPQHIK